MLDDHFFIFFGVTLRSWIAYGGMAIDWRRHGARRIGSLRCRGQEALSRIESHWFQRNTRVIEQDT